MDMNGYVIMANCYREAIDQYEEAKKKVKIYEFLATCDKEDIYNLVDSGAFNEIIRGYIKHCKDNDISTRFAFEDFSAKNAYDYYVTD